MTSLSLSCQGCMRNTQLLPICISAVTLPKSFGGWPWVFPSTRWLRRLCQHLGPVQQEAPVSVPQVPDQHRLPGLQQRRHHARNRLLLYAREGRHQPPRGRHLHSPSHRCRDQAQVSLVSSVNLWAAAFIRSTSSCGICWSVSLPVHSSISDSWKMDRLKMRKSSPCLCVQAVINIHRVSRQRETLCKWLYNQQQHTCDKFSLCRIRLFWF